MSFVYSTKQQNDNRIHAFQIYCADRCIADVYCTETEYQVISLPASLITPAENTMTREIIQAGFKEWATRRGLPQSHRDYASMLQYYKILPSPDARFFLSLAMECAHCDDRITVRKVCN